MIPFPTALPIFLQIVIIGAIVLLALLCILWLLRSRTGKRRRRRRSEPRRRRSIVLRVKRAWQRLWDAGERVAKKYGKERSGEWARVQDEHLLREPTCRACGYKGKKLQVHHIKPFYLHPELELEPSNLITLCQARGKKHHMLLGHLNYWASYNDDIEDDVRRFYGMSAREIKASLIWKKKVARRPK